MCQSYTIQNSLKQLMVLAVMVSQFCLSSWGADTFTHSAINLKGTASGGSLILCDFFNPTPDQIKIFTTPGEKASEVSTRLADAANKFYQTKERHKLNKFVIQNDSIVVPSVGYMLAGTETGLGIPSAPVGLYAIYDVETDALRIWWENTAVYDELILFVNSPLPHMLHGDQTSITLQNASTYNMNNYNAKAESFITIAGRKNNIPSSAAGIGLINNVVIESLDYPISNGIPMNWQCYNSQTKRLEADPISLKTTLKTKNTPLNKPYLNRNFDQKRQLYSFSTLQETGTLELIRPFSPLIPNNSYKISMFVKFPITDARYKALCNIDVVSDKNGKASWNRLVENGREDRSGAKLLFQHDSVLSAASSKLNSSEKVEWTKVETVVTLDSEMNGIVLSLTGTNISDTSPLDFGWLAIENVTNK